MRFLPNGLGGSGGDRLVVNKPVYMSGDVRYVSSARGDVNFSGVSYEAPLLTLASAVTASATDDVIVLASDHDETIAAKVTINKRLTIVGEGTSAGKPLAKLTNNQAADDMILVTSANVDLRNIRFMPNKQASSGSDVKFTSQKFFRMSGCYFEVGDNDGSPPIITTASATAAQYVFLESNTFVCATTAPDLTFSRLNAVYFADIQDLVIRDCIFDGGTIGFENNGPTNIALQIGDGIAGSARVYMEGLSFLRGADVTISTSGLAGYLNTATSTGAVSVFWS